MKKLILALLLIAAAVEYAYGQSSAKFRKMDAYITNGVHQAHMFAFPKKVPATVAERTLTASVSTALTFTAAMGGCPLGVAGADTNHYLYISGGTGTAEAVLITGGTCTSGATSGTIIFTPANNHSGAWTIESATAGIQEAIAALGTGGTVDASGVASSTLRAGVYDANKHVRLLLPAATITCAAHPAFQCSGTGSLNIFGAGKNKTTIVAATASGDVISKTCSGSSSWLHVEDLTISGNSTADTGIHINGQAAAFQNYSTLRVQVTGFSKASTGAALKITGANNGSFTDSDFNASTIGFHCTTTTLAQAGSCNLNRFYGGQMGSNARHFILDNAGATDSPTGNLFEGVEFVNATAAASLYVRRGLNNWIRNCWFEGNVAGTNLIQIGDSAVANDNPIGTVIDSNNFTEANSIDYLVDVQRGKGTKIIFNRDSQAGTDILARVATNGAETIVWANTNNAPPTGWPVLDSSGGVDTWQMGHETSFRKTPVGIGLTIPLTGVTTTPLSIRTPAAGTHTLAIKDTNGTTQSWFDDAARFTPREYLFANLGTPANGIIVFCSDCTVTGAGDNTCAGAGTGALAVRLNSVWRCFNAQN